jgi:hypothetical protein
MSLTDGEKERQTSVRPDVPLGSSFARVCIERLERKALAALMWFSPEEEHLSIRMAMVVRGYGIPIRVTPSSEESELAGRKSLTASSKPPDG